MNVRSLDLVAHARGVSQSELAQMAGVSRQAVSGWLCSGREEVAVRDRHLMALSRGLKVSPRVLAEPIPELEENRARYQVEFLWDGLYPSVESFVLALARGEPQALARLVSRVGLFEGAAVAGDVVWKQFDRYVRHLPPRRREELRRLWQRQSDLGLI